MGDKNLFHRDNAIDQQHYSEKYPGVSEIGNVTDKIWVTDFDRLRIEDIFISLEPITV